MEYLKALALPAAILALAAAVLLHDRYDGRYESGGIVRLDHLTGAMSLCGTIEGKFICKAVPRAP